MGLFRNESEDSLIREQDLYQAQRSAGYGEKRMFGAWALMRSSMTAESRELRAVERKKRSLEREKRRLERIRRLRVMTQTMFIRDRFS